ncbi:MAG: DUF285 domain-containing protein [Lachnospiraceae bacterium]|nr:DUF285 domain-containing protein [Lachnospiraceae bacterium]
MKKKIITFLSLIFTILIYTGSPVYAVDLIEWVKDWNYEITNIDGTDYLDLKEYIGTNPYVCIPSIALLNGNIYPVSISVTPSEGRPKYITPFNSNDIIEKVYFEEYNNEKVRLSNSDKLDDFFYGMENLESVVFFGAFDFDVSSASGMFENCTNLSFVDTGNMDFGNTTNFNSMFKNCKSIEYIHMTCPDGTNFIDMFKGCSSLGYAEVSGATMEGRAESVAIEGMFDGCTNLTRIDLSGLDTSKTTSVYRMFRGCASLESLDLSQFDLSQVYDYTSCFEECVSLKSIDLTPIKVERGIFADFMFKGCESLKEITINENFDVPFNVEDIFTVSSPTELKVKGTVTQSFIDYVLTKFESWNRYIGTVDLTATTEISGKRLEANEFAYTISTPEGEFVVQNDELGNITLPGCRIYKPGKVTFTIKEGLSPLDPSTGDITPRDLSENDKYSCQNPEITKTVNIVMNSDGTLSAEEV